MRIKEQPAEQIILRSNIKMDLVFATGSCSMNQSNLCNMLNGAISFLKPVRCDLVLQPLCLKSAKGVEYIYGFVIISSHITLF